MNLPSCSPKFISKLTFDFVTEPPSPSSLEPSSPTGKDSQMLCVVAFAVAVVSVVVSRTGLLKVVLSTKCLLSVLLLTVFAVFELFLLRDLWFAR